MQCSQCKREITPEKGYFTSYIAGVRFDFHMPCNPKYIYNNKPPENQSNPPKSQPETFMFLLWDSGRLRLGLTYPNWTPFGGSFFLIHLKYRVKQRLLGGLIILIRWFESILRNKNMRVQDYIEWKASLFKKRFYAFLEWIENEEKQS